MYKVILIMLFVLLTNVSGWGACYQWGQATVRCSGGMESCSGCSINYQGVASVSGRGSGCYGTGTVTLNCPNGQNGFFHVDSAKYTRSCGGSDYSATGYFYITVCDTKCQADSLKGCNENEIWKSDSCKCVPKPEPEADSSFTICTEDVRNGTPYATIYGVTCHYKNGVVQTCCGVPAGSISGTGYQSHCPQLRSVRGSCDNNGVPNGPSNPTAGKQVPDLPNSQCYAVVGYTCYMRDYTSGNTYSCECDGDCQEAYRQQMQGYGCRNPYPQPQPSSSGSGGGGGESSPSSSGSEPPSSSGSEPPSSSGSGGGDKDYTEQLNQIIANTQGTMNNTADISQWTQTTMNNTTDIKNNLTEIGIDVSHIRTNTENTATNTAQVATNTNNIDNKLSITNSLLQQLNNKNWSPNINITDTNIVNVDNEVILNNDTSKAPSEILQLMKDGQPNQGDTAGFGAQIDGIMGKIDSLVGDGMPTMNSDSVSNAMNGLKTNGLGAIRDTLNNSAVSDSMDAWGLKITDNGYITGQGSDNCPEILTRTWQIRFPIGTGGADVNIGPLGVYLCKPVAGMGITFWALCRVILRAMVAIACMIWLYKSVLGIDGGSNEED